MKKILLMGVAFLCFQLSYAQKIQDIKDKARSQKEKRTSSGNNQSGGSGNDYSSQSLGSEIAGNLLYTFLDAIFNGSGLSPEERQLRMEMRQQTRAQKRAIRAQKRADGLLNPKYGLELHFDFGGIPNTYQAYRPRIRGRIGVVSTDLRYSFLVERRLGERVDRFHTLDWQILQFTPVNTPRFSWRWGMGIIRESEAAQTYPEFATSMDIYFGKQRLRFAPEARFAWDRADAVRNEFNGELSYAVLYKPHAKLYLGLTGFYARYFETINIWSVGLGLHLKID